MRNLTDSDGWKNTRVVLASMPGGLPVRTDFRVEPVGVCALGEGEVLLRARYVSVDAQMRAHQLGPSGKEPVLSVGAVIESDGTAEVLESRHPHFRSGDLVIGTTGWQTHPRLCGEHLYKLSLEEIPETTALVALGTAAFTAYSGLRKIAAPQAGETLVVPAALSPTGAMVAQLGRIAGLWTVGITTGSKETSYAQRELGFNSSVDHTRPDFQHNLQEACPDGIDIFFDTVGGALWRQVRPLLNPHARVILTGSFAQYQHPLGGGVELASPATMEAILRKRLTIGAADRSRGEFAGFAQEMIAGIRSGNIWSRTHVVQGLERAAETWLTATDMPDRGITLIQV